MVAVHRRLNSTGRKRIPKDRIIVELTPALDGWSFPVATAMLALDDLGLHESALVVLEAYFRSSSMRFPCGTVRAARPPDRMALTEIDRGGAVQFRLLVIAADKSGRIMASAEGIKPRRGPDDQDREPLLPLRETDLGEELWRVEVDLRNGPALLVNSHVPGLKARLTSTPLVQGLILPHALSSVLNSLPSPDEEGGDEDWTGKWRAFVAGLDCEPEPGQSDDEREAREEWIRSAVRVFCERKRFASLVRREPQEMV